MEPRETGKVTNLDEIERLSKKLDTIVADKQSNMVDYRVEDGKDVIGIGLLNIPEIAIQQAFLPAGITFTRHYHECHEFVHVYKGKMTSECDGVVTELVPGVCCHVKPGESHLHKVLENTWCVAITIPAEKGYPSNGRR